MNRRSSFTPPVLILFLGSTPCLTAQADECPEASPCLAQRIDGPVDGLTGWFGNSVAQDGDRVIIGRPLDDELGPDAGAAFIYHYDPQGGWVLEQKLTAAEGVEGDLLGLVNEIDFGGSDAVAISGDFAMVGAPGNDDQGDNAGAVYVFQRQEAGWVQTQQLLAPEGTNQDRLSAVALEGDVAVVGAPHAEGYALVFRYDGSAWTYAQELDSFPLSENDTFGLALDISGGIIVVSALGYFGLIGAVFIYEYDDTTERWEFSQRLDAPDPGGSPLFGGNLDIGGSPPRIIVGAVFVPPVAQGAAYVYTQGESGWVLEQQLLATDCDASPCLFGSGVGIVSDPVWRAVVTTARFAAYEFRFDGTSWCETRQWQPPAGEADRHPVVSLQGERALLGMPNGPDIVLGRVYDWDLSEGCACPADLDGSGDVDFQDLLAMLSAWGPCRVACPEDLDDDGEVAFSDLLALLSNWGPC